MEWAMFQAETNHRETGPWWANPALRTVVAALLLGIALASAVLAGTP